MATGASGSEGVSVRSDTVEARILPASGGKVSSLRSTRTGKEWLWTDPDRPLAPRPAGGDFADHELSGWDECFPTVGPCPYPDPPFAGLALADHGELWRYPWEDVSRDPGEVALALDGRELPYRFERTVRAGSEGGLTFEYRVSNRSAAPLRSLWSMHPLFAVHPGMTLEIPGRPAMTKEFGFGGRLGPEDGEDGGAGRGDVHRWPLVHGRRGGSDLRVLDADPPAVLDKVVVRGLTSGVVALADPVAGEVLSLRFDPRSIPYLGVCINLGAWPFAGRPQRWVALEPTTGGTDRLDDACRRSEAMAIAPFSSVGWRLDVVVGAFEDLDPACKQAPLRERNT